MLAALAMYFSLLGGGLSAINFKQGYYEGYYEGDCAGYHEG